MSDTGPGASSTATICEWLARECTKTDSDPEPAVTPRTATEARERRELRNRLDFLTEE
jgi:hypothetical protein